jgi:fibronectin type 3 domain-containing protein
VSVIAEGTDSSVVLRWTLPDARLPDGDFTVVRSGGGEGEARFTVPSPMGRDEAVSAGLMSADEYDGLLEVFVEDDGADAETVQARQLGRAGVVLSSLSRLDHARVLGTIFQDATVSAGETYTYVVSATVEGDPITVGEIQATAVDEGPLPVIQGLEGEAEPDGVALRWELPDEGFLVAYRVHRIDPAGAETELAPGGVFVTQRRDPTTGESRLPDVFFRDTTAAANTTYTYAVNGVNAFGRQTARSTVEVFFPDPTPLPVPVIDAADVRDGAIELFWAPPADARITGIGVLRFLDPTGEGTLLTPDFLPPTAESYVDEGVDGGERYYYALVTVDANGRRFGPSPPWSARGINLTPPSAPTNLQLTPTEESLELSWDAVPEADVRGYQVFLIRQAGDAGGGEAAGAVGGEATEDRSILLTDSVLAATTYALPVPPGTLDELEITVRAVNTSNVEGPFAVPVRGRVLDTVPPAAPILGRIRAGEGKVELTWTFTSDPDVAEYRVSRTVQGEQGFATVAEGLAPDSTVWLDTDVTAGLLHAYRVEAIDASGNVSEPSAPLAATPYRFARPDPPTNLVARLLDDGGVALTWEAPATQGILTYIVERTVGDERFVQVGDPILAATREFTDPTGRAGVSYRVRAMDTAGNTSDPSTAVDVPQP